MNLKVKSLIYKLEDSAEIYKESEADDHGVTTAVLDFLPGFIAEDEKHSHVLLKSL